MGVPTASVQVENVCKRWGDTTALQDVSFTAAAGSLTVLLGSSGCGKSTLLRLVAGLDGVSAGHIRIGGRDVTGEPPSRRNISMVFQNYALFPHLSVGENILFGLRVRKAARADCDAKLARVAGLLGLGALLDRRPAQLSGGQQQRVAMGRAIIAEQPVCLMDEPMSNLDAQLRAEMRVEIQVLQKKLGITMLYVTHDQVEAMSMADQVVLLNAGRVEQVAPPAAMYGAPGTVFAARFIGTPPMCLLALESAPYVAGQVIAGTQVHVAAPPGALLGLRPEDVRLGDGGAETVVEVVEYLGADTILKCRLGSQMLQVRVPRLVRAAPGDRMRLGWAEEAVHLFDRETGLRRTH
jgi:sn-glycerol 3-phosphate transport system ATP-binding protein